MTAVRPTARRSWTGLVRDRRAATVVEFAICSLVMMLIIFGTLEFGRALWTWEVIQETAFEGARCMGLLASSCASNSTYSSTNTSTYIVSLAASRGVTISANMVSLNHTALCGNAGGFSQVSITYPFSTVAPALLTSLANGISLPGIACFPNNS